MLRWAFGLEALKWEGLGKDGGRQAMFLSEVLRKEPEPEECCHKNDAKREMLDIIMQITENVSFIQNSATPRCF